jgi:hypothetical protein
MADVVQENYNAPGPQVLEAIEAAVNSLGYKIVAQGEDFLEFKTGLSMKTWSGQRMEAKVVDEGDSGSVLRLVRQGSSQLYDWGEKKEVTARFFAAVPSSLSTTSTSPTMVGASGQSGSDGAGDDAVSSLTWIDAQVAKLKKRVREALTENLRAGEKIRVVIHGANGQAIIGTDSRLFVIKPGFMAGATFGVEATSWSYRNLVGIQVHKGMVTGAVVVQAPGQSGTNTGYWGGDKSDPYKAPNAIPIAGNWQEVRSAVSELQNLIDEAHSPVLATPSPPAASVADELKKLAELNQAGALTDEEFAVAKQQLISGS